MQKNKKILFNIILTAMMSALSFIMTYIAIPIGGSKVHLGNAICLLASLLFGPIVGGLSGSIGMGLNDLLLSYPPQTWIRTFIAKFIMGFVVGLLFKILKKREKINLIHFMLSSFIFFAIGSIFIFLMIFNGNSIQIGDKTVELNFFIPILSYALSLILIVIFLIFKNKNEKIKRVAVATSYATILNIIIEFIFKIILNTLFTSSLAASVVSAISSVPATILTGVVSICIASLLYIPISVAIKNG